MISNKGMSTLESAVTLGFSVLFISGFLISIYSGFLVLWLKHLAYESAICISTGNPIQTCRVNTIDKIKGLNFFNFPYSVTLSGSKKFAASRLMISLPTGKRFTAQKYFILPIKAEYL